MTAVCSSDTLGKLEDRCGGSQCGSRTGVSIDSKCVSWRQTGGCDPKGLREPNSDKSCNVVIPDVVSGYCECTDGKRQMEKGCSKGAFDTCDAACKDTPSFAYLCNTGYCSPSYGNKITGTSNHV